jgi:peptide/nickel transport system permease protein
MVEPAKALKPVSPLGEAWRMFRRNKPALMGVAILSFIVGFVFYGIFWGGDPYEIVWAPHTAPGEDGFLFGTDYLGRNLMTGLLTGGDNSRWRGGSGVVGVYRHIIGRNCGVFRRLGR